MRPILPFLAVFGVMISAMPSRAAVTFGFETPTYTEGRINGQDGWTSANNDVARVLTASTITTELTAAGQTPPAQPVRSGTQALFVSSTSITGNNATVRTISGLDTESRVLLEVWAQPLSVGGSLGNIFLTMEDSGGTRAAAFRFGLVEGTQTIDYGSNVAGIWAPSGQAWEANTWYHLAMDVDYQAKTYDFLIDGTKVNAAPIPFYAAASANFNQIRIFRGSVQSGMIVDDLSVRAIPEPTALATLLCGGLLGLRRRRK